MIRFDSKRGYLLAVICLVLMVVALGAAAKHSQFESPLGSMHYLKQSVKMEPSSDHPALEAPADDVRLTLAGFAAAPMFSQPVPVFIVSPVRSPLLI